MTDLSHTANLPALVQALPADVTRAAQTQFGTAAQIVFLEALATSGSVRSAARRAGTSHQSAYRARCSTPAFRRAWDAALLAARAHAEGELADRALNGVTEKVFYHGEQVDERVRYSDRLLLAHLGRLDRLAEQAGANALAEDFDGMLERFGRGEDLAPDTPAPADEAGGAGSGPDGEAGAGNLPPGHWSRRSMSPGPRPGDEPETDGNGDDTDLEDEMDAKRPPHAPRLSALGDADEVFECQAEAFLAGDPEWWRVGSDYRTFEYHNNVWLPELEAVARSDDAEDEDAEGEDSEGDAPDGEAPEEETETQDTAEDPYATDYDDACEDEGYAEDAARYEAAVREAAADAARSAEPHPDLPPGPRIMLL
ncbi:hypothetical protein [Qipengyuania sp. JC766]|uniref:hypothetical protein n=1 Tax=Qipengyuania sp. JC766 TaxID=3232139 RepID=UPI003457DEB2